MPRLPSIKFEFKSKSGDNLIFTSEVYVNNEGEFSVTIPDNLFDICRGIARINKEFHDKVTIASPSGAAQINYRIYASSLDLCKKLIGVAGDEYVTCETTTEKVILYDSDIRVCYTKDDEGNIYTNGYTPVPRVLAKHQGTLHATETDKYYKVGFAAKIFDKITYKHGSSQKIEYKKSEMQGQMHSYPETYHDKLNSFVGLNMPTQGMKEILYTEEAAKFFYELMIGMCTLADRLSNFINDESQVKLAIEQQQRFLTLPDKTNF
jgi:hypothetical protein